MTTRYAEMLIWGITFMVGSWVLIINYSILDSLLPNIHLKLGKKLFHKYYISDLIIILIMVFIVGIRTNSGSDYYNYLISYRNIDVWYNSFREILTSRYQNGLYFFMYLTKKIFDSDIIFFSLFGIVNYLPIFKLIRQYSKNPKLSIASWFFLGFFLMSLNILKQSISMVFIALALHFFLQKKLGKFIIFSLIATWFHISSILIVFLIVISEFFRPSRNLFYILSLLGVILLIVLKPILVLVSNFINIRYVTFYINSFLENGIKDVKLQVGAIVIFFAFSILLFFLTSSSIISSLNDHQSKFLLICLFMIPFLVLSTGFYIFNRLSFTGLQFIIFILPLIQENLKKYIYIYLSVFGILISILNADNNYYNYSTVFNDEPVSVQDFVRRIE